MSDNPVAELIQQIKAAEPQPIPNEFDSLDKMMVKAHDWAKDILVGEANDAAL